MTAENQLWVEALRREKIRIEELHKKAKSDGKESKAQFLPQRVLQPWVWSRTGPGQLFDFDDDYMLAVDCLDYDLSDPDFVTFLANSFQLHMCRTEGGPYWNLLQEKFVTREAFIEHPDLQFAQEYKGKRHKYSTDEMISHWRGFLRTRVYIQGAYDRYRERLTQKPALNIELELG